MTYFFRLIAALLFAQSWSVQAAMMEASAEVVSLQVWS